MSLDEWQRFLDEAWDAAGFLGHLRRGVFSADRGASFLDSLGSVVLTDEDRLPRRLVALVWYLPSFLAWQRERVEETRADIAAYDAFVVRVHNVLEEILGVP